MTSLRRIVLPAVIAAALAIVALAPPSRTPLAVTSALPPPVRGEIHIHTRQSDGTGTIEDVAAAAARAGLQFVIITDHGDATRTPLPPVYVHGVLVIDAVEVSTSAGHVVALGLDKAPYPLGGEPRDVVEDIARLGGTSIAAHPGSPKRELQWGDWTAPIDGLEWLNGDSEWRDEPKWLLARVLLTYPFHPSETLATLLDRPEPVMARWDALTRTRRVIGVAGTDAHARIGWRRSSDPDQGLTALRMPGYEAVFRTVSISLPQVRLTRDDAAADARAVLEQVEAGHVFSSVDALASPATFAFSATSGGFHAVGGDLLSLVGPVSLHVESNAHGAAEIALFRNGSVVKTATTPSLEYDAPAVAAVYRVEITLAGTRGQPPVPWIVSNPIYVGGSDMLPPTPVRPEPETVASQYEDGPATGWTVEHSATAATALSVVHGVTGTQIKWRYALGGVRSDEPYAAIAMPAGAALAHYDRLVFSARADRPMRISVQLRAPVGANGVRWRRSVYVDETPRDISVFFDDMRPVDRTAAAHPALASVDSVLFVAEATNTALGTNGQVWLDDVRYAR